MIKLIATDIDGTLVADGAAELPEGMPEVIEALMDKGVIFMAASGRSLVSIEGLFGPLKEKIYYAGCNGCLTGPYGEILFTEELDPALRNKMIEEIRQDDRMVPYLTDAHTMYDEGRLPEVTSWLRDSYHEDVTMVEDLTKVTAPCVKLSVYDKTKNPSKTFVEFQKKWKGYASVVTSGVVWLDVYKTGVNKGSAVKHLQEHFGITPEETMTLGDQQNDIELLMAAEHSYAIGNALPEVKAVAKHVADTQKNNGALKVFRELLAQLEEQA